MCSLNQRAYTITQMLAKDCADAHRLAGSFFSRKFFIYMFLDFLDVGLEFLELCAVRTLTL